MYSLVDGRRMYVPPFVAAKISAAGVRPGVPFLLCKREVTHGNRRTVEYQIETPTGHPVKTEAAALYQNAAAGQTSGVVETRNPMPTQQTSAVSPAPGPDVPASSVALMKMAGCGAVDAVLEIEKYAQSRGMVDFVFGAENVQKIAVTLFMEMNRKAGRAA